MKKFFFTLFIATFLAVIASYIFIPSKIKISSVTENSMDLEAANRFLIKENNWATWWPGNKPYSLDKLEFNLSKISLYNFTLPFQYKKDSISSNLQLISLSSDSLAFVWSCKMESSNNPYRRWQQYFKAIHIKKTLDKLTSQLKYFLGDEKNVYGFTVKQVTVSDSVLISLKNNFDHYPDEEEIGQMAEKLKKYIRQNNAVEKNHPMLNVHMESANIYQAMLAIATDRFLPATKEFLPKMVLKGGKILEAEITGGPFTIKKGFEEFENFKVDKKFISPAIPYQLMVTDRLMEKDTSKWITRFYYPIY